MKTERRCGNCTACCTAIGVPSIGKEPWEDCRHRTDHNCAAFKTAPPECREFECAWKLGAFRVKDRPDRLGLVIWGIQLEHPKVGKHFQVHVTREGAEDRERGRRIIVALLSQAPVAIVRRDRDPQMFYTTQMLYPKCG
jgi:hypothetical protein